MTKSPTNPLTCAGRERLSLDRGWRFHRGDVPFPVVTGHHASYQNAKAGRVGGAAAPDFDDSFWRELSVPHDWVVEGPFEASANLAQGYRSRGFGWYRRHLLLDPQDRHRHLELQFDGIATHATVWVNGLLMHRNFCGYTSFSIDITAVARFGEEPNVIAVRVDAEQQEGWWYEGGGIYRHVWLVKRPTVHITTDGVFAQPVRGADGAWTIPVEVTLANVSQEPVAGVATSELIDPSGRAVAEASSAVAAVAALGETTVRYVMPVAAPQLWSPASPVLYHVRTTWGNDADERWDEVLTPAGFRTLRFDAREGFFLNDEPLKIQGTCNHQDHAGVGVALPDALNEFRLRRLKDMGCNAYRCAHHPPTAELLAAADRLGLLVMDENRLFNCAPEYLGQLEGMVRRDRNHPCVFLWSVFNEEPMQDSVQGAEMVRRLVACVKALDTTRPVTAAMNGGLFAPVNVAQVVDVVGFNYQHDDHDRFHAEHPDRPLFSSEDTAVLAQRGEVATDRSQHRLQDGDSDHVPWGTTHRRSWRHIMERPYLSGGFIWTGFDYRGEPTPFDWPTASASFGCLDLCGFAKVGFYLRQAMWVRDRLVLHLAPHWNDPVPPGATVEVFVMSNVEQVELVLNGVSLGLRRLDHFDMITWPVAYAPGRLEAIGWNDGAEVVRTHVETTGPLVALRLIPDRESLAGDGCDAMPVAVVGLDAAGRVVPTADAVVTIELAGPGGIIGLGNGDPNSHEAEQGNTRRLYHGWAQVVVQSTGGSGGLTLVARADGGVTGRVEIPVESASRRPEVAVVVPRMALTRWRKSPPTQIRPESTAILAGNDQNSWLPVTPGSLHAARQGEWAVYRAVFQPHADLAREGGQIRFEAVLGHAEVWMDGQLLGCKTESGAARFLVSFAPGEGRRQLSVLVEAGEDQAIGLSGPVLVEKATGGG